MGKHGIFISYRHTDWALAGRIYDFLERKGLHPFWDSTTMHQGSFPETLKNEIRQAPYFLCLLTSHTFSTMDENDWVYREVVIALEDPKKKILLLAEAGFTWPANMPEEISRIREHHYDTLDRKTFTGLMEDLCRSSINWNDLAQAPALRKQHLHDQAGTHRADLGAAAGAVWRRPGQRRPGGYCHDREKQDPLYPHVLLRGQHYFLTAAEHGGRAGL